MFILVVVITALIGSTYATCSGNINSYGWTLDDIIDAIINDTDVNKDGYIDLNEARFELLGRWTTDDPSRVSHDDFVTQFVLQYWDDYALTSQFFHNMDLNKDGYISESDFVFIILGWVDPGLSDRVSAQKIRDFIHKVHPEGCKTLRR